MKTLEEFERKTAEQGGSFDPPQPKLMRFALLLSALSSVHARQAVSAQPHAACRLRGGAKDERTYAMMKPDVCSNRKAEADIKRLIEEAGLTIVREERCRLSKAECEEFYAEHSERPFFPGLVSTPAQAVPSACAF